MNRTQVEQVLTELEMSYGARFGEQYANADISRVVGHWQRHLAFADFTRWPAALSYIHRAVNGGRVPNLADVVEACENRANPGVAL